MNMWLFVARSLLESFGQITRNVGKGIDGIMHTYETEEEKRRQKAKTKKKKLQETKRGRK